MRYWEIDFVRGIAIIMMITYHFLFDLDFLGKADLDVQQGFLLIFARTTAIFFILLAGISSTISYARKKSFVKFWKRALAIFSCGLLVTLATWIFLDRGTIIFGILHFIGLAIILSYPLLRFKKANLLLGVLIVIIGFVIKGVTLNTYSLLVFGITPPLFYSLDYFPLLPWFGVMLIGIFAGHTLYPCGIRSFNKTSSIRKHNRAGVAKSKHSSFTHAGIFLGRHSLAIYLIHQPILFGVMRLL